MQNSKRTFGRHRLGRRSTAPFSESLSDPAASLNASPDMTCNPQPLQKSPLLSGDSLPDGLESCVESSNVEALNPPTQVLSVLEGCLAVARRIPPDGKPPEIQIHMDFVADMLRAAVGIIEECKGEMLTASDSNK
jgi:hypothetical protein